MKSLKILLVLIMSLSSPALAETYKGYAIPDYDVVEEIGDFEIRNYAPFTEARVRRTGTQTNAAGSGFRALAGYIFGGNEAGIKLAMTAPVVQEPSDSSWTVSFVLPKDITPNQAPTPNAEDIEIITRPATKMAVIRFAGFWNGPRLLQYETVLREALAKHQITAVGGPVYMFYDDPFTLPWQRRNEVGLRIKD
ncbi:MAG: heme-binding protein [Pseudomonadota bacterium]